MAISKLEKQDILNALKYIDKNGVPEHNVSVKYLLISEDGKKYPPKYTIALANHLANGAQISTESFDSDQTNNFLKTLGFTIEEKKKEEYILTIKDDSFLSTDPTFTMDDLHLGDNYKPFDAYFVSENGDIIRRNYKKNERKNSNQTLPRIACQIFEKQISSLSQDEKVNFPICKYSQNDYVFHGIYNNIEEFKKYRKTLEYMVYNCENGSQFVIYCWNIFSTIYFVQECLKRFGQPGDQFVLKYCKKDGNETNEEVIEEDMEDISNEVNEEKVNYKNKYSLMLINSKNLILRGAPGTGKSYLAKKIAADIISNGATDNYDYMSDEQKRQVEFVQFHPSYDYSDFVEGLRPKLNIDGTMGFELKDGIFKQFISRARKNYEDSQKSKEELEKETIITECINEFFDNYEFGVDILKTIGGTEFTIESALDNYISVNIPAHEKYNKRVLNLDDIKKMLMSELEFETLEDVTNFFGTTLGKKAYSYMLAIYKAIKAKMNGLLKKDFKQEELKKYVFIIDEINRGEISKIFGELFYSIDPGYRGKIGEISTQYSNMHFDPNEKFYIPKNVYIIGTMNDIDRSVDTFDFAMRRRFRFVEIKANEHIEMLDILEDNIKTEAIRRMISLNKTIMEVEELNENYQIGASYFLKLKEISFDELWEDYLEPLLKEYIQGIYNEEEIMKDFAKAYGYQEQNKGNNNEDVED